MSKVSKINILTSIITLVIFLSVSFAVSVAIFSFANLFMKDILLLVGLSTCTFGSLALMGDSFSSQIINPFVKLTPVFVNNYEEVTKEDLEISNTKPDYINHTVHHLRKSTFEFALSGALLILVAII
ncbi:MAG: hypothetical protein ACRC2K_08705 [Clostridium sp.]